MPSPENFVYLSIQVVSFFKITKRKASILQTYTLTGARFVYTLYGGSHYYSQVCPGQLPGVLQHVDLCLMYLTPCNYQSMIDADLLIPESLERMTHIPFKNYQVHEISLYVYVHVYTMHYQLGVVAYVLFIQDWDLVQITMNYLKLFLTYIQHGIYMYICTYVCIVEPQLS